MSRYFKYNYLNPNNFGTRGKFFRHRGCKTDEHKHLKNLDNWESFSGQKGLWVLEESDFISDGQLIIEDGQTLCIAHGVTLTVYGHAAQGNTGLPTRLIVYPGGVLSIAGTVLCIPSVNNTAYNIVMLVGGCQIKKTGILENYVNPNTQNINTILFKNGTFLNEGLIINEGQLNLSPISGEPLVNNGHIDNTGSIVGNGTIDSTGGGTCTGC